jgi:NAD(P) transhydrogenase
MGSKPLVLPGRHLINSGLLATNIATLGAFVTMAPAAPAIAAMCLTGNAVLSFIKGYTTTAAIGGAGTCSSVLLGSICLSKGQTCRL